MSAGGSFRDNYLRFARVKCSRGEIRNIFELPESMQAKREKKSEEKKWKNEWKWLRNEQESLLPSIISWLNFAQVDDLCSVIATSGSLQDFSANSFSQLSLSYWRIALCCCAFVCAAFAFDALNKKCS